MFPLDRPPVDLPIGSFRLVFPVGSFLLDLSRWICPGVIHSHYVLFTGVYFPFDIFPLTNSVWIFPLGSFALDISCWIISRSTCNREDYATIDNAEVLDDVYLVASCTSGPTALPAGWRLADWDASVAMVRHDFRSNSA